jgi:hypothetical protein
MIERLLVAVVVLSFAATPLAAKSASSLTVTNRMPGSELVISVRQPLHAQDVSRAPGCAFTMRSAAQEVIACPKVLEYKPGERTIAILKPDGARCTVSFVNRPTGWETHISGSCEMRVSGESTLMIMP